MPGTSRIDLHASPPRVELPRDYNAAYDLLERHVDEGRGDRIAIIDDDGRHSYRALAERARRAGAALAGLGVRPEQRVAMCMLDSVDFVATFLGAIAIGAVPVPVNTLLTADDYAYLARDMRAAALIGSDALLGKLGPAIAEVPAAAVCETALGAGAALPPGGALPSGRGLPSWRGLIDQAAPIDRFAATTPDDVAFWLYSSGSTGRSKGAMHLHGSLIWTAALYAQPILGLRPDDVVYSAAKLFFAYGLGNALTFPLSVGGAAVLSAERPTPASVMRVLRAHQPTVFCGVPTLFAQLLATPELARDTTSRALRISTSAGEALPRHIGEQWRDRMGTEILDGIGSTEMLHIFLSNRPGDVHYGTTGRPVPGYELELRGDDDRPVGDGEEGALWVRGPSACAAYWNDRARSLATFHGPWTRTGDRYTRNADGTWTYGGRADDMLKVGGIWVSPFEVESALAAHPAVLEAAVVGAEDKDGLIKPKAFVVLREPGAPSPSITGELQAFVKATLAPFKYPRWIEVVGDLPKTATGKIQRFRLRSPAR